MKRVAGWLAAAALVALMIAGMLREAPADRMAPSSRGIGPGGYRALYESLERLGFPVGRGAAADVPANGTVWWLERGICRAKDDTSPWAGLAFAERGGTAIALLPDVSLRRTCHLGEGLRLRARPHEAHEAAGPLAPALRRLDPSGHVVQVLKAVSGWRSVLDAGRGVLALDRPWGAGRVVVVGDATLLANYDVDRGDHALVAVDLVRAYGVPVFDEVATLRQTRGAIAYLATSAAAPVFVGLAVVALLLAWHGALVPARGLPPLADPTPRLDGFVDSIATLYSRSRDHGRVLDRYRALITGAFRRHFALAPDVPDAEVIARARRLRPTRDDAFALLAGDGTAGTAAALRAATTTLDRLLEETCL